MEYSDSNAPACTLGPTEGMTRRQRWLNLADVALLRKIATPAGVQLRYRGGAEVERELRELAELEKDCCSFATWSVAAEGSGLVLDISAEGEGVESVQAMFGEAAA